MACARTSLRDVARRAGVSPSTVSNVLNGRLDRMRADTSERVLRAMRELGYTPNQVARQLRTGQVSTIGLIVPSVANPFWGLVARGVEQVALERDYHVLLCNSERDPAREAQFAEILLNSGMRGLIFGSSSLSLDHLAKAGARGLRVVTFDRSLADAGPFVAGSVEIDNVLGARLAVSHLLGLGHRRIGLLSGPIRTISRRKRLAGYRQALADAGVQPSADLVWEGPGLTTYGDAEGAELGRIGAHHLLSVPARARPTALLTINDMYAIGACAGARDLGLRVPQDISVIGFDDLPVFAEVVTPPLTTVRQPVREMMRTATAQLLARLEGETDGSAPEHAVVTPKLVIRSSTSRPSMPNDDRAGARGADQPDP
ncbi:LacI family DNA-binding transcriptional regulator [Actinopolymorpha pittospori]|uniref:DNA-binding LacI/PurR family transcriptional regulator n=1 Tax=Actinopolymorpha pittospori TaxID=648752 RepID=A0A927RDV1_9ACTN|nr:LacI family DNA-binding transcriptional regulator [Actinopolymorpha pittospori]MBE1608535.1 DNA-binding LacI/PurR family transcriptional regulator [Actinopolymorpha pittospori]